MAGFAIQTAREGQFSDEGAGGGWDAPPTSFFGAVQAAWDDQTRTRNLGTRAAALQEALWARHEALQREAGVTLKPSDFMRGVGSSRARPDQVLSDDAYERQLQDLVTKGKVRTIETKSEILARLNTELGAVRAKAEQAGAEHPVAAFLGGAAGSFVDVPNLGLTMATAGAGAARPLLQRMGMQALANAGVEAAEVPGRVLDAGLVGPKYKPGEAVQDVLFAGVAGAGFEVLGAGARAALRRLRRGAAPPASRYTLEQLDRAARDDAALGPLDGAAHEEGLDALDRGGPPPRLEPAQEIGDLFGEGPAPGAQAATPGASSDAEYYGRRITATTFDPAELGTDAATFQYKADADAQGVTARLRGVDVWDPTSSGKVLVFERADGSRVVADGHQRRALAQRMGEKGWDARLDGYLFREADGWTARQVRTIAALKNIREGSGTILDAAKVFRDAPEHLNDRSLPITGEFISQARSLARLSAEAFGAVVNKVIPERYAAEIGAMAGQRPDLHPALVKLMRDGKPANVEEARALVSEAMLDDWVKNEGEQADFFGGLPPESTTIARAKVKAAVAAALRKDAKIFGQLVKHADAIEAGGNALARDANEVSAAVNRTALEVINRLALRQGEVGDAMAAAAREVLDGKRPGDAARGVLSMVRNRLKAGEALEGARAAAIAPEAPSAAALAPLEAVDDPKTWEAASFKPPEQEGRPDPPGLFDDLEDESVDVEAAHQRLLACAPAAPVKVEG